MSVRDRQASLNISRMNSSFSVVLGALQQDHLSLSFLSSVGILSPASLSQSPKSGKEQVHPPSLSLTRKARCSGESGFTILSFPLHIHLVTSASAMTGQSWQRRAVGGDVEGDEGPALPPCWPYSDLVSSQIYTILMSPKPCLPCVNYPWSKSPKNLFPEVILLSEVDLT